MPRLAAVCIPPMLALSACTDVTAVQSISSRLVDATSGWQDVSAELERSCERGGQFNPELGPCTDEAAATRAIQAVNLVLATYFGALADAASGQTLTIQPGLDALGTSVAKVPGIDADQVQAATRLAGVLARLATGARREHVLRGLIGDGVPPARRLIAALRRAVPRAVARTLAAEQDEVTAHFAIYIGQSGGRLDRDPTAMCARGPGARDFSGPAFLLALEFCRRTTAIEGRAAALASYTDSLARADQALADLASGKTRLKGKALARQLYATGKELSADIGAVRKAF